MTHLTLPEGGHILRLHWQNGDTTDFPLIWLRDNDPDELHPQTQERIFDLLSVPHDITARHASLAGDVVTVVWDAPEHTSHYPLAWLRAHRPGTPMADPAQIEPTIWRADLGLDGIPRHDAGAILTSDTALSNWMHTTQAFGLSIVHGLADTAEAGMNIARRIGHLRETNFGLTFEVFSKQEPNNLAYTPVALPLHTDLTNQELPPGFQFLHCLINDATGGGSIFADGYAMAEDLRTENPEAFEVLSTITVPFRFHDRTHDIRTRKRVINLTDTGAIDEICYNAHLASIFDLAPDTMRQFYAAYRAFMAKMRDDRYRVTPRLQAGEMAVFDNRRVLHGRQSFDPTTGGRHLHGTYVDRGEFLSRIRRLALD